MHSAHPVIKPNALSTGDTVMLITPRHHIHSDTLALAAERMQALGLKVLVPPTILDREGYFAGTIEARAQEINRGFANPEVKALIAVRGGSGGSQVVNQLDYHLIKNNPKIIMGMSDTTALLLAIQEKTGLVTFHGPNAGARWPKFTVDHVKKVLFDGKISIVKNPKPVEDDLIQTQNRITTIHKGVATGISIGGNLTVISTLMGSRYLPQDWRGKILFVEEVGEAVYRIDRMLAQLENAGILAQLKGFIFGTCQNCPSLPRAGFQLSDVIARYINPLGIPAISGALIGHQAQQFVIPVGLGLQLNADKGEITLGSAVHV